MAEVPVVLFVFNRPDHLADVLGQLQKNNISKLYVFCDGPRGPQDDKDIAAVRQVIHAIDWVEIEIFEAKTNQGLSESIISGLSKLFTKHQRLIVIEDDIIISPGFYKYMQEALEHYDNQPTIAGVTGLCYPIGANALAQYPYDTYFEQRFCSWGWGTWADAWNKFSFDKNELISSYQKVATQTASLAGDDMAIMAPRSLSGELGGSWDVMIGANMLINKSYFVWPKYNMVCNDGIGTGTHLGEKPDWELVWGEQVPSPAKYAPVGYKSNKLDDAFISFFKINNEDQAGFLAKTSRTIYNIRKSFNKLKRRG